MVRTRTRIPLDVEVGPGPKFTPFNYLNVRELLDEFYAIFSEDMAEFMLEAVERSATPARPPRRGQGFRQPRGGWPVASGRSLRAFRAVREVTDYGAFMGLVNSTPYAKALERGAPPTDSGIPRRPKGRFIRRLWNREGRDEAEGLVREHLPQQFEESVRKSKRRRIAF